MKVLLVESSMSNIGLQLSDLGHTVETAAGATEIDHCLTREDYSVVLLDATHNSIKNLELCRHLRDRESSNNVYIIVLSQDPDLQFRLDCLDAGADDVLLVPAHSVELAAKLRIAARILELQVHASPTADFGISSSDSNRSGPLGSILVSLGVIDPVQLRSVLAEQGRTGDRVGTILLANKWATEEDITRARSVQLEVPYCSVLDEDTDPFLLSQVTYDTARRYQLLPLTVDQSKGDRHGRLRVAMANPGDIEAIDLLQHQLKVRIEPLLASGAGLRASIEKAYRYAEETDDHHTHTLIADTMDEVTNSSETYESFDVAEEIRRSDEAPVVAYVNSLLSDAVRRRASDIHIEPRKRDFQVLYRMDGFLQAIRTCPRQFYASTISRLKIMSEMDISERRLPQDGRITLKIDEKSIDLRISTLPTQFGERVVLRVLDRSNNALDLNNLGLAGPDNVTFKRLLQKPHGLILLTGPTGSGKTTTLYAALNAIKEMASSSGGGRRNIITCEDPIEYELEGISQSAVNEKAGLTFVKQLRAILRQDPDVVLVGEIRDAETAEIAFRASLTGHLVLSTLHCNEAAGAISRLLDIGLPPYLIASALSGVIAQRLVRQLCPNCCEAYRPDDEQLHDLSAHTRTTEFFKPTGCVQCDGTGTKGRSSVHEIMVVDHTIRRMIKECADTNTIRRAAIEAGMTTLITDGLEKASRGIASLDEILFKVGLPELDENRPAHLMLAA
jgi:type II secretory ATPase GspE/PulE/Tfp pilus assembly ATPase PilB-like protein/CheY-like chemotaxis protein